MIKAGERAPEFTLRSDDGRSVALRDLIASGPAVIFFYPKDGTPGCTLEAGAFAKRYDEIRKMGAEVVGVSTDGEVSHSKFKERCELPFLLLSDPSGEVRKAYGIPKALGVLPGRATFVIDRSGVIRRKFIGAVDWTEPEIVDFLSKL